jgi:hypothetical protein
MTSNIPEDYDKYNPMNMRVLKVEGDPKNRENYFLGNSTLKNKELTKYIFYSILIEKIEKFSTPFEKIFSQKEISETLKAIKILFTNLKEEDLSKNLKFAEELSLKWHKILDFVAQNLKMKHEDNAGENLNERVKNLVKEIHSYPEGKDHTLGIYLTENLGQNWIPFPFIQILYKLHEEAILDSKSSKLNSWIKKIEEIEHLPIERH